MMEITNEQKEQMANFWGSMITNKPQEFVVKEKYDELQQEIERLNNVLDNIGYKIEGIIKNNERIGITKATGEIISKHDIELLKNILKMIDTQDISIRGDKE